MNRARVWAVAKLDLLHNLRRPLLWIWVTILVLVSWGLSDGALVIVSGGSQVGGEKPWLTSEFNATLVLSLIVFLLYPFFLSILAGMPVIRDGDLKVSDVVHSTGLTPREYVWGRFLAVMLTVFAVLAVHLVAIVASFHLLASAEVVGPFDAVNYLRPALFLVAPLLFFLAGTAFAVGARFRRPIVVFFLPVAIFLFCLFFLFEWSPDWLDPRINYALQLIDPAGFRWLGETWLNDDRGVEFYNTQPVVYEWPFLLSRVVMVVVGLMGAAYGVRTVAHTAHGRRGRSQRRAERKVASGFVPKETGGAVQTAAGADLAELRMRSKPRGWIRAALAVARVEMRELRNQPGIYLFAPLILLQAVLIGTLNVGAFDTPMLNTPGILASRMSNALSLMVCLLLLFYTVESLARERRDGVDGMLYAVPVRTSALLFGKALANSFVGAAILVVALLACGIVLAIQGTVPFAFDPFVLLWGGLLIPTFLFWSSFVALVQSLVRNRYTTYALCLGALIWSGYRQQMGDTTWASNWNAWGVAGWSDMDRLAFNAEPMLLNRALYLSCSLLLVAATVRFFDRRERDAVRTLHRLRPLPLLAGSLRLGPYAVAPIVLAIFLSVRVSSGFQSEAAEEGLKDYWRKNVATFTDYPLPGIDAVDVHVELEPERRWLRSKGKLLLRNLLDEPLRRIPLTGGAHWEEVSWELDGEEHEPDDREGLYVFVLEEPMQPGATLEIGFAFEGVHPRGITRNGGGTGEFILPSGAVLTGFTPTFVPVLGFVEGMGVDEENEHDPREYLEGFHLGRTPALFGSNSPCRTRIRVTAPEEFRLNSVGTLEEETVTDGRRTALWVSDHPVYMFNIIAGKWDVASGDGTAIYYHPDHDYNIEEMLEALDGARVHYSEWFMPFPWQELKLSEFPALAGYAQGFATNITFSEAIGFLTRSEPKAAAAFMVTAHEAAHQWWGNILLPGRGPGGNVMSEGMAHFSTILLADEVKGERYRIEFCKRIEGSYCEQRQPDSEKPLAWVDGSRAGDTTVMYDKGGFSFWMLLNHMGRDECLRGIQAFLRKYDQSDDHAVTFDFLREMRPFAPDAEAYDAFCAQAFLDVVLPEYQLSEPAVTEDADGTWSVTLELENVGSGDYPVEVAAYRGERFAEELAALESAEEGEEEEAVPAEEEEAASEAYRDSRVTVRAGADETVEVTIRCDFEPEGVIVDPDARVLQLRREKAAATL